MGLNWPMKPDAIPAKYVLHWFTMKRPNQHRGTPEMSSVLGLGASPVAGERRAPPVRRRSRIFR